MGAIPFRVGSLNVQSAVTFYIQNLFVTWNFLFWQVFGVDLMVKKSYGPLGPATVLVLWSQMKPDAITVAHTNQHWEVETGRSQHWGRSKLQSKLWVSQSYITKIKSNLKKKKEGWTYSSMVKPLPIVCRALGSVFSTVSKNLVSNITPSVGSLSFHPGRGGLQDKGRQLREKRPGMGKQACNPSSSDRRTVPNLEQPWAVQQPQASQGYTRPCLIQWQQKREAIEWYLRSREASYRSLI